MVGSHGSAKASWPTVMAFGKQSISHVALWSQVPFSIEVIEEKGVHEVIRPCRKPRKYLDGDAGGPLYLAIAVRVSNQVQPGGRSSLDLSGGGGAPMQYYCGTLHLAADLVCWSDQLLAILPVSTLGVGWYLESAQKAVSAAIGTSPHRRKLSISGE